MQVPQGAASLAYAAESSLDDPPLAFAAIFENGARILIRCFFMADD